MELLEAVRLSTKKTTKKTVISWKKVATLMGSGKPEKWESEYRRKHGDMQNQPKAAARMQSYQDLKKGIEAPQEVLISQLKNTRTIEELMYVTNQSRLEVLGGIEELRLKGYEIILSKTDNQTTYKMQRNAMVSFNCFKHYHDVSKVIRIGLISDTHLCSKFEQMTYLQMTYDVFEKEGIKSVYHAGDMSEGHYTNRPGHIYEIHKLGFDEQKNYIVKNYPKRDGITTYFISGNHDATHVKNGGANIGVAISDKRSDMVYLGHAFAKVWLTEKVDMDIEHPGGGSSYAYSYKMQKRIDSMTGGSKPKILINGHFHKNFSMFYRNIWNISMASMQAQTPFMRENSLVSDVGFVILEITVNNEGDIIKFNPIYHPYYVMIENDYIQ